MITKSQTSGVEKKGGCSLVCCHVWVLQCSVVAVGCYGQTAKAVMRERATLYDNCIELCGARDANKILKQEMRERDGRSKRYARKRCGMVVVV